MTDAEKMREAAALLPCPFCGCTTINTVVQDDHTKWHECDWCQAVGPVEQPSADPPESWNRRALPVDASAPAADCQQAGLVTVDAAKYGRRNVQKMIRQWDAHRTACRAEGTQAIQDTLDAMEEHIDYAYRANTVPPGLLDEVKAALRLSDIDRAMLQSMAISFRARMDFSFNPDDMADLLTRVSAALARLEREVG